MREQCKSQNCTHYGNAQCNGLCNECYRKRKRQSREALPSSAGYASPLPGTVDELWMKACRGAALGEKEHVEKYCNAGGSKDRKITEQESASLQKELGFATKDWTLGRIAESRDHLDIVLYLIEIDSQLISEAREGKRLSCLMGEIKRTPSFVKRFGDLGEQALKALPNDIRWSCYTRMQTREDGLTFLDMRRAPCSHSLFLPKEIAMADQGSRERALGPLVEAKHYLPQLKKIIEWWPDCGPGAALMVPVFTSADLNCLLHACSLTSMGVRDSFPVPDHEERCVLRDAMYTSIRDCKRLQEAIQDPTRREELPSRLQQVKSEARKDREALDGAHIFVLANVLRRPIICHADAEAEERELYPGEPYSQARQGRHMVSVPSRNSGIYLPLLWSPDEVSTDPLVIANTPGRIGHFTGLCPVEPSSSRIVAIPLFDAERVPLPVPYAFLAHDDDDGWLGWAGAPPAAAGKAVEWMGYESKDCTDILKDYLKLDSDVHGLYAGMRVPVSSITENSRMVSSDLNTQVETYTEVLRRSIRKKLVENS